MTRKIVSCIALLVAAVGAAFADNTPAPRPPDGLAAAAAIQPGNYVAVLKFNGTIDPISARFVIRGLAVAEREGAALAVIQLDTPGGVLESMKQIVEAMLASKIPVAVFVAPAGARAASAGVFVTLAAQIAAMAPGTNIGAAHPVTGSGGDIGGSEGEKIVNDAVAKIRALADLRERNASWAEEAVRKSVSLTVDQAIAQHVVDLKASDVPALLAAVNGRSVSVPGGTVLLRTEGLPIKTYEMNFMQSLLSFFVDPSIAYILFLVGIIGLVFEFHAPGVGVPGVLGGIALLISLISFGALSVNLGGVLIIALSVLFFLLDIKAPTHGILTAGGIIAFLIGSFLLFPPWRPTSLPGWPKGGLSPLLIASLTLVLTASFAAIVSFGVRAQGRRITAGSEALIGRFGTALSILAPAGLVRLDNEEWSATSVGEDVAPGEEVQVIGVEGVHLVVMKKL